jgi:hypothetical protein
VRVFFFLGFRKESTILRAIHFFETVEDCVVEGMFVDIIVLDAVSLENHPVVNFKRYPLVSRNM